MNRNARALFHVSAVARHRSFTRAAAELGITQSALTRSIQALEHRTGVRLFDRDRSGVSPTRICEDYVERAEALLREWDDLDAMLVETAAARAGHVRFGIAPLPGRVLLHSAFCAGLDGDGGLRLSATVGSVPSLMEGVLEGKLEFCVCAELLRGHAGLSGDLLGRFPISLLVRTGHPALGAHLPGLAAFPLVASSEPPDYSPSTGDIAGLLQLPARIVVNDFAVLESLTAQSDAIWLSSSYAASEAIASGRLAELPLPAGYRFEPFRMMMYTAARRSLSPAALVLRDHFRSRIARLARLYGPADPA